MQLDQRDLAIVQLISRFGQLSTKHVQQLIFSDLNSHTPADRTLVRLLDRRYVARIERRIVGGSRGGSGQYVYQLGSEGHRLFKEGRWIPARAINYHSLVIADCYVVLRRLERAGRLTIRGYLCEPDSHEVVKVGAREYYLKPDLYAELERPGGQSSIRIMFEIDMGTQGQRQITEKFVRYWGASQTEQWPENQIVVFVAIDEYRAQELRWILDKGSPEQRELFKVHTLESFEQSMS